MNTNLTAKDVGNHENIQNQTVTDYPRRQVQGKGKISVFSGKDAKTHEPSLKQIKTDQSPRSAQRPARDVSSGLQSDHSPAIHPEAAHQSLSTGEFYFANDPLTQQRIIDQLRHEQP